MRRLLVFLLAVISIGVVGWVERRPVLQWLADVWIVSDSVAPADAVAVFGGGLEDRPFAAAAYYRQGLVKKVLISNVHAGPAEHLGVLPTQVAATRDILFRLGVPESAVETFGDNLKNTHDEALALRAWADRTGAQSVIVPTEIFPTRRTRWILDRVFGKRVSIRVVALDLQRYRPDDWWHHEEGILNFQNEVIKYLFYRLQY